MYYKNGRRAKVGDPVVGTTINHTKIGIAIAGTLVSFTPGPDAFSGLVGFIVTVPEAEVEHSTAVPDMVTVGRMQLSGHLLAMRGTEQHGTTGPRTAIYYVQDYAECRSLLHAEDAWFGAQPLQGIEATAVLKEYIPDNRLAALIQAANIESSRMSAEALLANAKQLMVFLEPILAFQGPDTGEQPPADNAHVAEGCQTFGSKV